MSHYNSQNKYTNNSWIQCVHTAIFTFEILIFGFGAQYIRYSTKFMTVTYKCYKRWYDKKLVLFSVDFLENLEDLNEEVDDVQVEVDGSHDVFFRRNSLHDHLGVKNDKS